MEEELIGNVLVAQSGGPTSVINSSLAGVITEALNHDCIEEIESAMKGMTKSLAILGAPYNVRACCVIPGPVLTRPGMANMKTLLGRAAEPIELVDFILYLCSDKAAFITGSSHVIDGGRLLLQP